MFRKYKLIGTVYKSDGTTETIKMSSSKRCMEALDKLEAEAKAEHGDDCVSMDANVFVRGNWLVRITSNWS